MTVARFNTLDYANKLKSVGMDAKQAETMAQLQEEIIINSDNHLVTKKDLSLAFSEFEIKITSLVNSTTYKIIGLLATLQTVFHFLGK